MSKLNSAAGVGRLRERLARERDAGRLRVRVCSGTGCRPHGSEQLVSALRQEIEQQGLASAVKLVPTGCHGFCARGPLVVIEPNGIFYQGVAPSDAPEIVARTLAAGEIIERLLFTDPAIAARVVHEGDVPFYQRQRRIVLDRNGIIDPTSIADYIALGGYGALAKAIETMTPAGIIEELVAAKLRGRGGAGFLTGVKWRLCREAPGDVKYIVCNADEGDPGAFMDDAIMAGNPHRVLEGMILGAYAIGAGQGFVYIRNEYPLAVAHLRTAIAQAKELGLLGQRILGSDLSFDIEIRLGSGAFVCGEETALMASIEGRIGEPRPRPPFPAQSGLWGRPTNINNVETWANVPLIVEHGAAWFAGLGTEASGGTKIFSLVGKINNTGLVEVPIGATLGEIIYDIGGGIPGGKAFKAAQIGGPAGGCVPREHLNVPIDYATLKDLGAIMGSGGLVVCDEDTCMVDLARYFLKFTQEESCGKCLPCRVGTKAMLETLERICAGQGREGDIEYLIELGEEIKRSSLCGLGQNAANPVLSTIRYFRAEYEAHIRDKRCPAGVCQALVFAPCENECPAGMNVPGYVSLIGEGRTREALALMLDTNPFPSVCGRVCDHPCEPKCRRNQVDAPVAIRALKRFAADQVGSTPDRPAETCQAPSPQPRVAIAGGGPAGLSCAYFLARLGYRPTVFERLPVAGGMLAVGIPDYRLPKQVLQREIAAIAALGVEMRTNTAVGRDVTLPELQRQGYQAIFLATGAHRSLPLGVPGEDLPGVVHAVDLLREAQLSRSSLRVGKRVAVIGGGNAAIDAARTALRLGAEQVTIIYRRTRAEMPAQDEEIVAAEQEGIEFRFLAAPVRLVGDAQGVRAIACQLMRLGEFDKSGRRQPVPSEEPGFELAADMVIVAVGQAPDTGGLCDGLAVETGKGGTIRTAEDGVTSVPFVFAGGDVATGPATVIRAIAAGQRAAMAIDRALHPGEERTYPWATPTVVDTHFDPEAEPVPYGRCSLPEAEPSARRRGFEEVEGSLSQEAAMREALRCLRCDYRETEA